MKVPRVVQRVAATKPNKNASDSRDIFGDMKTDPVAVRVCPCLVFRCRALRHAEE